ncbi:DMT family transporter [Candidatus Uhrbacteria bacterium]|nr:DMT family transporter [Candidatus Uhrbacteria bacterium]
MKNERTSRVYGSVAVFLSALFFGSYGVWSRLIGSGMGNFFQGWTRALIIIVLILPFVLLRREFVRIGKQDRPWLAVFLVCTSMTQAPLFYAYNHMDIGTASLLFFVSMFLTMNFVGIGFFREKMTTAKVVAIGGAIVGMCLVFSFSTISFSLLAALMALANGVASGGEIAFSKKLSSGYSPLYLHSLVGS